MAINEVVNIFETLRLIICIVFFFLSIIINNCFLFNFFPHWTVIKYKQWQFNNSIKPQHNKSTNKSTKINMNTEHVAVGGRGLLTVTLWWSWNRTAVLTGCSSPSTVVEMTEDPRTVPKYLITHVHTWNFPVVLIEMNRKVAENHSLIDCHSVWLKRHLWLPSVTVGTMEKFSSGVEEGRREAYQVLTSVSLWKPACSRRQWRLLAEKRLDGFGTAHCCPKQKMPADEDEKLWKLCSTIVTQILNVLLGNRDAVQAGSAFCFWATEAGFSPFLLESLLLHLHFWKKKPQVFHTYSGMIKVSYCKYNEVKQHFCLWLQCKLISLKKITTSEKEMKSQQWYVVTSVIKSLDGVLHLTYIM